MQSVYLYLSKNISVFIKGALLSYCVFQTDDFKFRIRCLIHLLHTGAGFQKSKLSFQAMVGNRFRVTRIMEPSSFIPQIWMLGFDRSCRYTFLRLFVQRQGLPSSSVIAPKGLTLGSLFSTVAR